MQMSVGRQINTAITRQRYVGVDRHIGDARLCGLRQPLVFSQVGVEQFQRFRGFDGYRQFIDRCAEQFAQACQPRAMLHFVGGKT